MTRLGFVLSLLWAAFFIGGSALSGDPVFGGSNAGLKLAIYFGPLGLVFLIRWLTEYVVRGPVQR